jgi:5-hydroxyisourate hydrolase
MNPALRLQALTTHLSPKMATKDPITCHVLDTTTGRPAAGIKTTLLCNSQVQPSSYVATTNSDGRITNWAKQSENQETIESLIKSEAQIEGNEIVGEGQSVWRLTFETGAYYQGKCFFPTVDLTFLVKEGEHFHVPLLLGPYSYTTYRGS